MKEYCYNCSEKVEYTIKEKIESFEVQGVDYGVIVHAAYCKDCGKEIYVTEIKKENNVRVKERVKELKNLI